MAKPIYVYEKQQARSLKELAEVMEVSRVLSKDLEEGGKYADVVTIIDPSDLEEPSNEVEESTEEPEAEVATEEPTDETSEDEVSDEEWEDKNPVRLPKEEEEEEAHPMERESSGEDYSALEEGVEVNSDEVQDSLPEFESLEELKEFIKDFDTPTLEYMAKGLGLTWKPTDHKNIHRMRIAMAMHEHYFPKKDNPKSSSKGGKYKDYTTEDLEKLLDDNGVEYKTFEDANIHRMRLVMTAKKHSLLPE